MKFSVLGSGSKGNCTYIEAEGARLLIDNGFSAKELLKRLALLGVEPESLQALLVTHEHDDHVKGVGVLARRLGIPVYANAVTHRAAERKVGKLPSQLDFGTGEPFTLGSLHIHPFAISHDTADPVGFVFSDGESTLGYCTDTGQVTRLINHHLRQCQALILEANHDVELLRNGPYPLALQQRVLSNRGHLANAQALSLADALAGERLRILVLAHLSEINNHPDLVLQEAQHRLAAHSDLQVLLATQAEVGPLLDLSVGIKS